MKARIFISSTYYDLRYLREQIISFVANYEFEPVAFEKNGIAYNPKQSMIVSCIEEIKYCHAVILIIGNRYGSEAEANISVTRREYREAVKCNKPIFVFIENGVYGEYNIYCKNDKLFYKPVIADSIYILEFIDEISLSGIYIVDFKEGNQIINSLRGQWAGFFSDFLIHSTPEMIQPKQRLKKSVEYSEEHQKFKEELITLAENRNASAMLTLGYYYLLGNIFFERDFEKAYYWISTAANEQNYPTAKNILGSLYYRGVWVKQSFEMSFKYKLEAANEGCFNAMESVAFQYMHGIGCKRNINEAINWYIKYTDRVDNAVHINAMGEAYEWINDLENAAKAYERASDRLARASYNLAKLYHRRLIGNNDYMLYAVKYYKKAADKGWTEAYAELGKLFFQGSMDGVETKDFDAALIYLTKAAEAGVADSQYILAHMNEYGLGVNVNIAEAINNYRKAALQGHSQAQFALGQIMLNKWLQGDNTEETAEVFKWIKMSFDQGCLEAKRTMFDMYKFGIGCNKSNVSAREILDEVIKNESDDILDTINYVHNKIIEKDN